MSTYIENVIRFNDKLSDLTTDQASWSQATFGLDSERGPIGALRHLSLEALEAAERPTEIEEYADCFLLLIDATRRAGWKLETLVDAAITKQKINAARSWPKPISDEPVMHEHLINRSRLRRPDPKRTHLALTLPSARSRSISPDEKHLPRASTLIIAQ